jgi:hypothetical protein
MINYCKLSVSTRNTNSQQHRLSNQQRANAMTTENVEIQYNGTQYNAVIKYTMIDNICESFGMTCSNDSLPDELAEYIMFARIDGEKTQDDWFDCDLDLSFKVVK